MSFVAHQSTFTTLREGLYPFNGSKHLLTKIIDFIIFDTNCYENFIKFDFRSWCIFDTNTFFTRL